MPCSFSRSSIKFQGHTGQKSPILTRIDRFRTVQLEINEGFEMMHKAWCNVPYNFSGSSIKFQGHTGWKIDDLNPIWVRLLGRSQLSNPSDLPCSISIAVQTTHIWNIYSVWHVMKTCLTLFLFIFWRCWNQWYHIAYILGQFCTFRFL